MEKKRRRTPRIAVGTRYRLGIRRRTLFAERAGPERLSRTRIAGPRSLAAPCPCASSLQLPEQREFPSIPGESLVEQAAWEFGRAGLDRSGLRNPTRRC